jgi:hypothetical protein
LFITQKTMPFWRQFSSLEGYTSAIRTMLLELTASGTVSYELGQLAGGGNLDGAKIRQLCRRLGINYTPPKRSWAGVDLTVIRDNRNALAHGNVSFAELGQGYAVSDLKRMKMRAASFLVGLVHSSERFRRARNYRRRQPIVVVSTTNLETST